MPKTASTCDDCSYPINFDTYKGCPHKCIYCFANNRDYEGRKGDYVVRGETDVSLRNWINGARSPREAWSDWNIPICWGRNADPFPFRERIFRYSLKCLKLFAETKYPFIITTKSTIPTEEPYFSLWEQCNVAFQYSIGVPTPFDKIFEPRAPSFEKRLEAMHKLAPKVKRMIARCQPLFLEHAETLASRLKDIKAAGATHILFGEAYVIGKDFKRGFTARMTSRCGRYFSYKDEDTMNTFRFMKRECENAGLVPSFERRHELNTCGDCCGCAGIESFVPNRCTLGRRDFFKSEYFVSKSQATKGSGVAFRNRLKDVPQKKLEQFSFQHFIENI